MKTDIHSRKIGQFELLVYSMYIKKEYNMFE